MNMAQVLRKTAQIYRANLKEGALCVLLQLTLRLMVCAPLLFLITKEVPYLALVSVPLYFLIIPVARQNMAQAMQTAIEGGPLLSAQLISMENYGKKVCQGLKRALLLVLWSTLFIAATVVAVWAYAGQIDAFTLVRVLMDLGGGSFMNGIKLVLLIYAATLLPIIIGCAFHSGARHAYVLGNHKQVKAHRGGVMLTWVVGLITLVPFFAVTGYVSMDFVAGLVNALSNLGFDSLTLPSIGDKVYVIAAAFVVLVLPALPFKQLMTAVYVRGLKA